MKVFIVLGLLSQLLLGAQSSWFKKHEDYVERVKCMYGVDVNGSTPHSFPNQLNNPAILYYQLDGKNDSVRYVWSFVGTPTLYMSVVPAEQNENCSESILNMFNDWDGFINNQSPGSINIPGYNEDFAFSIVFNELIEFTDIKHKAYNSFDPNDLNNTAKYRAVNTSGLDWFFDGHKMELVAREQSYNASLPKQFSWTIKLYVPIKPDRVSLFPKTLYTVNSTVFDFVFNNFNFTNSTNGDSNYGRLVLGMDLVHGLLQNGSQKIVFSRDDEYTPSVFLTYNQFFGKNSSIEEGGFLQWKPISYLSHKRKSTQSQQAKAKNGKQILLSDMSPGLVTALYTNNTAGIIQPIYMIFGTEGDDNNPNPQYVTWTGMLGFGAPPQDEISMVVILTICIGLGVPALLIGLGGVFLVIKRKPWKKLTSSNKNGYTKLDINNNDTK